MNLVAVADFGPRLIGFFRRVRRQALVERMEHLEPQQPPVDVAHQSFADQLRLIKRALGRFVGRLAAAGGLFGAAGLGQGILELDGGD